jgi:hypothetical protein
MALDDSVLSELLEMFRAGDGLDLKRTRPSVSRGDQAPYKGGQGRGIVRAWRTRPGSELRRCAPPVQVAGSADG